MRHGCAIILYNEAKQKKLNTLEINMRARNMLTGEEIELSKQQKIDNMLEVLAIALIRDNKNVAALLDYIEKIQEVNKE